MLGSALKVTVGAAFSQTYDSTMQGVRKDLTELGKTQRETQRDFKQTEKRLDAIGRHNSLSASIAQREALLAQKERVSSTDQKAMRAAIRRRKQQERQLERLKKSYAGTKRELNGYGIGVKDLAQHEQDLTRQIKQQKDALEGYERRRGELMKKRFAREGRGGVGGVLGRTAQIGKRILGATVAVGGAAVGGVVGAGNSFADRTDSIAKTSDKLGFTIEGLQELHHAAELSGVGVERFNTASQRSVRRIAEAANGSGEAVGALEELGLYAEELAELSPEEQFNQLADALSGVENQGDRVKLAMKLFDSEGVDLVNMLGEGSAGLEKMRQEARDLGVVMDEDTVRAGVRLKDSLTRTGAAFTGIRNIVGAALLPVLDRFSSSITSFAVENRPQIEAFGRVVGITAAVVGTAVGRLFKIIGWVADKVFSIVGGVSKFFGVDKVLGAALEFSTNGAVTSDFQLAGADSSQPSNVVQFPAAQAVVSGAAISESSGDESRAGLSGEGGGPDNVVQFPQAQPRIVSIPEDIVEQTAGGGVSQQVKNEYSFVVHAAPGMNEEQLAREVASQMAQHEVEQAARRRGALYD